jgi:RimJ/RimL family protein N-acetyltransferase
MPTRGRSTMNIDTPELRTPRLRLTALREDHFDAYARMLADHTSTRHVGDGKPLDRLNAWRSMAMLLGHWVLRGYGMWAVELLGDGRFIGRVGLLKPEGWPDLELGWMIEPGARGQGYATEAASAALEYAWRELRAERVVSLIRPADLASEKLAAHLGGERVDTLDFCGGPAHVFAYHPPLAHARTATG